MINHYTNKENLDFITHTIFYSKHQCVNENVTRKPQEVEEDWPPPFLFYIHSLGMRKASGSVMPETMS